MKLRYTNNNHWCQALLFNQNLTLKHVEKQKCTYQWRTHLLDLVEMKIESSIMKKNEAMSIQNTKKMPNEVRGWEFERIFEAKRRKMDSYRNRVDASNVTIDCNLVLIDCNVEVAPNFKFSINCK